VLAEKFAIQEWYFKYTSSKGFGHGHTPDYHKHCKVGFGTYVQTHEAQTTQWRHRQFEISLSAPLVTHMVGITSVLLALLSEYIVLSGQNPQCECKNLLRTEMVSQFWDRMMN